MLIGESTNENIVQKNIVPGEHGSRRTSATPDLALSSS